MEPKCSLPCSQELATFYYPEPDDSNPQLSTKTISNIFLFLPHM